jgi:5'-deoxynucleotidase YfbR-like HD superfamily hydrolase
MKQAWNAAQTRRWHTNADLSHTNDPVGAHSARVAVLALLLQPGLSRAALVAALTHDLGEYKVGDFPAPFKWANPEIADTLKEQEAAAVADMGFVLETLTDDEAALIKLCDMLDAWLWMQHHVPHIAGRKDWANMQWVIAKLARDLGHEFAVLEVMGVNLGPA